MDLETTLKNLLSAVLFGAVGILVFVVALKLITTFSPFSVKKEIAEDQNVALGILVGSIFIGLAIIVGSAVHG
jgi:uncharacterized membrane protein YjfL (UPF0719 family)